MAQRELTPTRYMAQKLDQDVVTGIYADESWPWLDYQS